MQQKSVSFSFQQYDSIEELPESFQLLLSAAKKATQQSYAPYSGFQVGAAALLENGEIVTGSNQENASLPVGLCAERVTLSAVSSAFPNKKIIALAITAFDKHKNVEHPVSPCGLCRQSLLEYEQRFQNSITLILQGMSGPVYIIPSAGSLLPLAFAEF
jgi:cytidine deaminase